MNGLVKEGSIGAILFQSHIITEAELVAALEAQKVSGCRVGEALVRLGVVTQEDIDWALANQLNIPYVRLKKENIDPAAIALVPAAFARRYHLFPLFLSGGEISVAMTDPLNREAIDGLAKLTGCQVTISVGLMREILEMQDAAYGPKESAPELGFSSKHFSAKALEAVNGDLSAGTLLNHLLLCVVRQKFASLVLQPLGGAVRVLARGGGRTTEIASMDVAYYGRLTERIRKLAGIAGEEGISCHGVLNFLWQGKSIPFLALLIGGYGGEYVTLKLQIPDPRLAELADLGLSRSKAEDLLALTREPEGLILFSGPEPDARCRLMDLFVDACDSTGRTVLLLGERLGPAGNRFPRLPVLRGGNDQTVAVVAAALEHDPDTLVVEDVTELGAFVAAGKAVVRGKLVVAGMAHHDQQAVLTRLMYLRDRHLLLATQVKGVVSCKGVLILCPACKKGYTPDPGELAALRLPQPLRQTTYFRPHGCPACDHTGYGGRRYLLDVLRFDQRVLEGFESLGTSAALIDWLKENGYRGIAEEGLELLERGEISPDEYIASILL